MAQSTDGSITGRVIDNQQAAIVGANVTAVERTRNVTLNTKSDESGRFVFPVAPPGAYTITVEVPGFKKYDRTGITLNADDKLTLGNLTMEVGALTQTVEVSAEVVALKTESAERSDSLVAKQIENIAVNGRNPLDLVKTIPGIVSTANFQVAGSGGLGSISANGARTTQNATTINGIGNVDTGANGSQNVTVSIDSIQEFKVLSSSYQAEYGKSSGAQIIMLTKSGSSSFHGSSYWYHRNESLNANNWKNNRDGLQRNKLRLNDLGYTIGGPVIIPKIYNGKNRLFFFASQEYQRQLSPNSTRNVTMPTALERAGDFSQTVDNNGNLFNTIKDPQSPNPCTTTNTSGCFQDGGVLGRIPKSRLYAPGVALLNFYPLPNAASTANKGFNFQSQLSDVAPRREDLIRIDFNLTNNQRIFGHWINNANLVNANYGSSWAFAYSFPVSPITNNTPGSSWAVGHTWSISSTMTNDFLIGDTHNLLDIEPSDNAFSRSKTGINLPVLYPKTVQLDLIPQINSWGGRVGNAPTIGSQYSPFRNYNTTIDISDNVTKVIERHTLKGGIYMQRSRKDQTGFSAANGSYNFGNDNSNPLDTGFGFANAAVGVFSTFSQSNSYLNGMYRYTNLEGYIQDTWKVTQRLTLDYGLRMAWYQPQFDAALQTSTFVPTSFDPTKIPILYRPVLCATCPGGKGAVDPTSGAIVSSALTGAEVPGTGSFTNGMQQAGQGINKYLMRDAGLLWAPRLGIAWDITGHQNLVLRTGGGIFYDRIQGNKTFDMITNPPSTVSPTLYYGNVADISTSSGVLAPPGVKMADLNGEIPTVYSWNFGLQSKIFNNFVLDTAYVGSKSEHLPNLRNLNAIPYGTTFLPQNQDPTKTSTLLGNNAYAVNFLRPYMGYGDITAYENTGYSNYNSLQVSLTRRFAKGLFLGLSYTWSHALGNTSADGDYRRIDQYDRQANYSNTSFDRRHNLVVNYVYEAPRIFSNNGILHAVVDGWQASGVTIIQTGSPYTPSVSFADGTGSINITGSYTEGFRLPLIGQANTNSDDPYNRLNPAAFGVPKVGSIGLEAPTRYLFNPGTLNFDMSLSKRFSFKERAHFELRVDAFNAFNHTQFNGINSGLTLTSLANPTATNLVYKADGSLNNKNGFGSVSGARDPRILQTVIRFQF